MYGMGKKKLAGVMDIEEDEAQELLGKYHEQGAVRERHCRPAMRQAEKNGSIRTALGRKCRFDHVGAKVIWLPQAICHSKKPPRNMAAGADQAGVYIQGAEQADPRFKCRPDKEGDGGVLFRRIHTNPHGA